MDSILYGPYNLGYIIMADQYKDLEVCDGCKRRNMFVHFYLVYCSVKGQVKCNNCIVFRHYQFWIAWLIELLGIVEFHGYRSGQSVRHI